MGRQASALLVAGTSSGAGKSSLCVALGRLLARAGVRVAPFKAINLSLNSAVTSDGAEIARAQALQAQACGIAPTADMNPVLLKPEGKGSCQVIVHGRPLGSETLKGAWGGKGRFVEEIRESYARVAAAFDAVVIEGAGAAGEPNLRARDLANFWMADVAGAPALVVGDIERGGAFASLYGTWSLLSPMHQARIVGFVINKLHGDASLLGEGPAELQRLTGVPVIGVIPYLADLRLDAEDSLSLDALPRRFGGGADALRIAVPRLPHIANFTDLEPLAAEPAVELALASAPETVREAHVVLLPGSKQTVSDLAWLRSAGLEAAIRERFAEGGIAVGLCGGFQMLGQRLLDPDHVESDAAETPGIGLLPVETRFAREKVLAQVRAAIRLPFHQGEVGGYEVHCGRTTVAGEEVDGASIEQGRAFGTYLHGLFENDSFRADFLAWARKTAGLPEERPSGLRFAETRLREIDRLADAVRDSLDLKLDGPFGALRRRLADGKV